VIPPSTNKFKSSSNLFSGLKQDGGFYDLLLHKRDVAFTSPQLSSLISSSSLFNVGLSEPRARLHLDLTARIKDPELLAALEKLEKGDRNEISEILSGVVSKHSIYLTKRQQPIEKVTLENRVCVMGEREGLWQMLEGRSKEGGWPQIVRSKLEKEKKGLWRWLVDKLDNHSHCEKTVAEIVHILSEEGNDETDENVLEEMRSLVNFSSITGQLLVRGPGVNPSPLSIRHNKLFDKFYTLYD